MTGLSGEEPAAEVLPILGLTEGVLLPGARVHLTVSDLAAYGAAREAVRERRRWLGVFGRESAGLRTLGVVAEVVQLGRCGPGRHGLELRGLWRARQHGLLRQHPFSLAPVSRVPDPIPGSALAVTVLIIRRLAARLPEPALPCQRRARQRLQAAPPEDIAGAIMPLLPKLPAAAWREALDSVSLDERLALVAAHLHAALGPGPGAPAPA